MTIVVRSSGGESAREYELRTPLLTSVEAGREEIFLGERTRPSSPAQPVIALVAQRARPGFDAARERVLDAAQDEAAYVHPNVTGILDTIEDSQGVYLILEHIDGNDLGSALGLLRARGVGLPFAMSAFICHEVLKGMHHLHTARDAHGEPIPMTVRDVSPANILVSRAGRVKLAERSLAAALEKKRRRPAPELLAHFAPECIAGEPFSVASDIYGMGVLLFELLLGEPCFPGATKEEVLSRIVEQGVNVEALDRVRAPLRMEAIVERATYAVPERRFRTAYEMSQALEQFLRESGQSDLGGALARWLADHDALTPAPWMAASRPEAPAKVPRLGDGRSGTPAPVAAASFSRTLTPSPRAEGSAAPFVGEFEDDDPLEATLVGLRNRPLVGPSTSGEDPALIANAIAEVVVEASAPPRRRPLDEDGRPRFDTVPAYRAEAIPGDAPRSTPSATRPAGPREGSGEVAPRWVDSGSSARAEPVLGEDARARGETGAAVKANTPLPSSTARASTPSFVRAGTPARVEAAPPARAKTPPAPARVKTPPAEDRSRIPPAARTTPPPTRVRTPEPSVTEPDATVRGSPSDDSAAPATTSAPSPATTSAPSPDASTDTAAAAGDGLARPASTPKAAREPADAIQERTLLLIVVLGLAILSFIFAFAQYRERTVDAIDRAPREAPGKARPTPPRR